MQLWDRVKLLELPLLLSLHRLVQYHFFFQEQSRAFVVRPRVRSGRMWGLTLLLVAGLFLRLRDRIRQALCLRSLPSPPPGSLLLGHIPDVTKANMPLWVQDVEVETCLSSTVSLCDVLESSRASRASGEGVIV